MMKPIVFGNASQVSQMEIDKYHFDYIKPDEQTQEYLENARYEYGNLLSLLHTILNSRERSLAITHLEQSLMFATKAIVISSKGE